MPGIVSSAIHAAADGKVANRAAFSASCTRINRPSRRAQSGRNREAFAHAVPEQRNQIGGHAGPGRRHTARRAVVVSSNVLRIVRLRCAYFEAKAASIASTTLAIAFFAMRSTIADPEPHSCSWPPCCWPIDFSGSVRPKTGLSFEPESPPLGGCCRRAGVGRPVARGMPHLILNPVITGTRSRF